jgi:hypothetical protein
LPRRNTVNPSPNSLRKNVPNWLTLFKLMKNHMDLSDHFFKTYLSEKYFKIKQIKFHE